MKAIGTKTYSATTAQAQSGRRWYLIDAEGQVLGRVATTVAQLIRGKDKPTFTPHMDGGDFVIVINADKIVTTGKKETQKIYYRHSQYPGGLKATPLRDMRAKHPGRILEAAVRGMLPKNRLGREIFHHLKIYAGPDHPHEGQKPIKLELARDGHKRGQVTAQSAAQSLDAGAGTTPANMVERATRAPRYRPAAAAAEDAAAVAPSPAALVDVVQETATIMPATPATASTVVTSGDMADEGRATDDPDEGRA